MSLRGDRRRLHAVACPRERAAHPVRMSVSEKSSGAHASGNGRRSIASNCRALGLINRLMNGKLIVASVVAVVEHHLGILDRSREVGAGQVIPPGKKVLSHFERNPLA
jgi:hypothetical protein